MGLGIEERLQAIQADPATTFEAYAAAAIVAACACSTRPRWAGSGSWLRPRLAATTRRRSAPRPVRVPVLPADGTPEPADRSRRRRSIRLGRMPYCRRDRRDRTLRRGRRTAAPPGSGTRTCTRARRVPLPDPGARDDHGHPAPDPGSSSSARSGRPPVRRRSQRALRPATTRLASSRRRAASRARMRDGVGVPPGSACPPLQGSSVSERRPPTNGRVARREFD